MKWDLIEDIGSLMDRSTLLLHYKAKDDIREIQEERYFLDIQGKYYATKEEDRMNEINEIFNRFVKPVHDVEMMFKRLSKKFNRIIVLANEYEVLKNYHNKFNTTNND